ncbi:diguanylate cyclase (GGDEF)-like protein/PAS domain S-box-containing protein [Pelomonas saccharophila]|uniref:Diguanylate cyclase (GGDEF)-like protein/PAS domain S-box-containing protein n=1 Tax=Roseateles saccharophilus TaxID=304 RepID=A0ABU1YN47_ROSSA|nr:EAL domain-containing protein [Roseateles saccharophilus]MDR7270254.1 diguanylate cyclase (GGDEF)-like protein/PAS domain S-box-containing protein [Roseateles saccharophilus]
MNPAPEGQFVDHHAMSLRRLVPQTPQGLAAAYAAFGLTWIILSDKLLQAVASDVATLSAVSQGKGLAFVLATSGLIYFAAARGRQTGDGAPHPSGSGNLLWVFALLSATVVLTSLVSYASSTHKSYQQQVEHLRREAGLKADMVQGWVERRTEEARQLTIDPQLRASVQRWQRSPDEAVTAEMRRQLLLLLASSRYADALLLDGQGQLLLAPDSRARILDPATSAGARAAMQRGLLTHGDFQARENEPASLQFDLFVPLPGVDGRAETVLLLRTAPHRTLLPQLQTGSAIDTPTTLFFRPASQGVLAIGADGSDLSLVRPADAAATSLAALSGNPSLAGTVLDGVGGGNEAQAAVAAPIRGSAWYVAMQAPRSLLEGNAVSGAATLAIVDILAVLAAGAVVYGAMKRRELQATSRMAAAHQDKERAWKVAEAIANCSTDTIFAKDLQGRYLFVNRELCKALGRTPEQLIGSDSTGLYPADQVRRLLEDDAAVLRSDRPVCLETRLTVAGRERIYTCSKGRLVDDEGRTIGVYGVASDITERRDLQQRMRQWSTVFEDIRDGVVITDSLGHIQLVNRAFTAITGYASAEAVGASMQLLHSGRHDKAFYREMWASLVQSGHWQGEIWNRRKSGEIYPEWLTISAVREDDGSVTHYVGVFTDISRLRDSEAQADWLAHHDPLTHLPNRMLLQSHLEQVLLKASRHESLVVVMVIDLDGFKTVNDSLGHPAGDELLVCVAERLKKRLRHTDFFGRLGGDEFLVILDGGSGTDRIATLAGDLLATVSAPIALSCGQDTYVTASIGISTFPDDGSASAVELLRDADAALYRAKDMGRNRFCFYTEDMNGKAMAKLDLEAALSRAIERDELLLHYQPKVDAHSGETVAAEALLRWNRAGVGLVSPGEFIPLAEHSSLILAIGAWVIDTACRQIRTWMDAGLPVVPIAVNVAARQFAAGDLDGVVGRALEQHRVPARCLELELTEGMLISNPQAGTQMLQRLRDLGVKVSLDDFGTGYSSLAYLQQFPIDALKIDQSFVRRIGAQPDGEALVDAVIGLAHRLRLRVVAEGVETPTQRDHLRRQGCDEMQGYHFGRPDAPEALQRRLAAEADLVTAY